MSQIAPAAQTDDQGSVWRIHLVALFEKITLDSMGGAVPNLFHGLAREDEQPRSYPLRNRDPTAAISTDKHVLPPPKRQRKQDTVDADRQCSFDGGWGSLTPLKYSDGVTSDNDPLVQPFVDWYRAMQSSTSLGSGATLSVGAKLIPLFVDPCSIFGVESAQYRPVAWPARFVVGGCTYCSVAVVIQGVKGSGTKESIDTLGALTFFIALPGKDLGASHVLAYSSRIEFGYALALHERHHKSAFPIGGEIHQLLYKMRPSEPSSLEEGFLAVESSTQWIYAKNVAVVVFKLLPVDGSSFDVEHLDIKSLTGAMEELWSGLERAKAFVNLYEADIRLRREGYRKWYTQVQSQREGLLNKLRTVVEYRRLSTAGLSARSSNGRVSADALEDLVLSSQSTEGVVVPLAFLVAILEALMARGGKSKASDVSVESTKPCALFDFFHFPGVMFSKAWSAACHGHLCGRDDVAASADGLCCPLRAVTVATSVFTSFTEHLRVHPPVLRFCLDCQTRLDALEQIVVTAANLPRVDPVEVLAAASDEVLLVDWNRLKSWKSALAHGSRDLHRPSLRMPSALQFPCCPNGRCIASAGV